MRDGRLKRPFFFLLCYLLVYCQCYLLVFVVATVYLLM